MYEENDAGDLAAVIRSLSNPEKRGTYGDIGRQKVLAGFGWEAFGRTVEADFAASRR
jgi:hypothetical protein